MWRLDYSSKASLWDCYAKYEISLLLCLFSKEHPGKWKIQAHNERFVKTRLEAGSSVSYCKFLADIQLLLLFCLQVHLSVWCHQIKWGREPEQIGLTVSYSLPASQHMLLLYKAFLETGFALKIHRLYTLLKANKEKYLWKKCVCVVILQSQFWPTHLLCSLLNLGNASKLTVKFAGHKVTMVTCP